MTDDLKKLLPEGGDFVSADFEDGFEDRCALMFVGIDKEHIAGLANFFIDLFHQNNIYVTEIDDKPFAYEIEDYRDHGSEVPDAQCGVIYIGFHEFSRPQVLALCKHLNENCVFGGNMSSPQPDVAFKPPVRRLN